MRTLQIGLEWFPEQAGGLQRYYYELFRAAPGRFDMHGIVLGSQRVSAETQGAVRPFARPSDPLTHRLSGARRMFAEMVHAGQPDLIVSHFPLFTWPVLDRIDRPLLVHFHGPWASESMVERASSLRAWMKGWIEAAVFRRACLFIVLSQAFAKLLHENYGVPSARIRVIPGGVDVARFNGCETRRQARERLGWPTERPILLAVRRLVRRMGLEALIDAMRDVVRHHPDVLLLIAGRGPVEAELAKRIDERGLHRNVGLVGFLADTDLPSAYRAADICVVPSEALEGFGLIALEAFASGTPAVVTPVGGLPEVVAPLSPSLVLEGTGSAAIAAGLVRVLGDASLPGARACRSYAAAFDWPIIAERITEVYEEALSVRTPRSAADGLP